MGSMIVSRGSAKDLNMQYIIAIAIPKGELFKNASIKVTTAAVVEHIVEVKRKPSLSYTKPVKNLKQARVKELKLKAVAIYTGSIPISFICALAIPPVPCRQKPVKKMQTSAT
jgi:hypothetical protein